MQQPIYKSRWIFPFDFIELRRGASSLSLTIWSSSLHLIFKSQWTFPFDFIEEKPPLYLLPSGHHHSTSATHWPTDPSLLLFCTSSCSHSIFNMKIGRVHRVKCFLEIWRKSSTGGKSLGTSVRNPWHFATIWVSAVTRNLCTYSCFNPKQFALYRILTNYVQCLMYKCRMKSLFVHLFTFDLWATY